MPTAVFYSLSSVFQYLTMHHLFVLCHYAHCCFLQTVHCLSEPHTVPSVCSVSLCPLLSFTVCPLSVRTSHCTVCLFCVSMPAALFYSVSAVCHYFILYLLFILGHYNYCCLLKSVFCLSVSHTEPSVRSGPLYPLLFPTVRPLSVSTSHWPFCLYWITMFIAVFYSLSNFCLYFPLYLLLILGLYSHYCILVSVLCLSVFHSVLSDFSGPLYPLLSSTVCPLFVKPHTVPSVSYVSLYPLLSSTICPMSVSTLQYAVLWFRHYVQLFIYILPNVCYYLILNRLLVVCHYVYRHLQSVQSLSVPHTIPSIASVSLCPLPSFTVLPAVCQDFTLYCLFVLCLYVQWCFRKRVHFLSFTHTVRNFVPLSLCTMLSSTDCPLSVIITFCTVICPTSIWPLLSSKV